jgi:hypothetical protein
MAQKKGAKRGGKSTGAPKTSRIEAQKTWNTYSQVQPFLKNQVAQYNKPYYISQMGSQVTLITTSTIVDTMGGIYFGVSGLNQLATLQGLFDQYKIIEIEVWIQYSPVTTTVTAGQEIASQYATVVDYDDANSPASYNALLEFEDALATTLSAGHYHRFKPHVAMAVYSGAFTSFANIPAPWIDSASSTVQHYGVKVAAQLSNVANPITITYRLHTLWRSLA